MGQPKATEERVIKTFEKVLPELSESEREKLLYFGEGIAFKAAEIKKDGKPQEKTKKTG
ncbi:hypothetical protein NE619_10580 [Anaerovorax odorimutans]|uniref:Uncharacterized protein n=1 Tax=Anaerovorax odorimutans TaxID=109327 RepID=A0ABT1RPT0_9FIRM|nr:hypothetical protein [Anaerovorax odorimutans]MCQ4637171.1 hypothetical protein [Anaerovorax odorimutans]